MTERKPPPLRLLIVLSVLLCLLAGATLALALLNSGKQDDLRARLDAAERDTARLQDLHDRDARLTGKHAGKAEAARQELSAVVERVDDLADSLGHLREKLQIPKETPAEPFDGDIVGPGGYGHHVVAIIDRALPSDSEGYFNIIRRETQVLISSMRDRQDFHVIFYGGPKLLEGPGDGLVPATPPNQSAGVAFVDAVGAAGREARLAPALARAIDLLRNADPKKRGKLIYILAANPVADAKEAQELVAHRADPADIVINPFMYGPENPELRETLSEIAKGTNGRFRHVTPEDIAALSEKDTP